MKTFIKNLKIINASKVLFFAVFFTATSCSKSDTPAQVAPVIYKEEATPVSFLEQEIDLIAGIENITQINTGNINLDFEFKSKVKGKINSVSVYLNTSIPDLKIKIWDVTAETEIGSTTVTALANTRVSVNLIVPTVIEKNKSYVTSIFTDKSKVITTQKTDKSDLGIFPYMANGGNIIIENSISLTSAPPITALSLDKTKNLWYNSGLDFKFQRTE